MSHSTLKPWQRFNVGIGKRVDLIETFEVLKKLTGYKGELKFADVRSGDVKHSVADISLIKDQLGYVPQVDFEEGLRRTIEWYKTQENAVAAQRA